MDLLGHRRAASLVAALVAIGLAAGRSAAADAFTITLKPRVVEQGGTPVAIECAGDTDLPDGAAVFLELSFDGAVAKREKVFARGGRLVGRALPGTAPASARFGPYKDLRFLTGSYALAARFLPGLQEPALRAKLGTRARHNVEPVVEVLVGTADEARREAAASRRAYRQAVADVRATVGALVDAYGAATFTLWPHDRADAGAGTWAAWVKELRAELIEPITSATAPRMVRWTKDGRFRRDGKYDPEAWRRFVEATVAPKLLELRDAARDRTAGVVAPRVPDCARDLGESLEQLEHLQLQLAGDLARLARLGAAPPAPPPEAGKEGEREPPDPKAWSHVARLASYDVLEQLVRAVTRRLDELERSSGR